MHRTRRRRPVQQTCGAETKACSASWARTGGEKGNSLSGNPRRREGAPGWKQFTAAQGPQRLLSLRGIGQVLTDRKKAKER